MPDITVSHLSHTYHLPDGTVVQALSDLNAHFPAGSFSVVVGPSGCGKTTLLRLLAGLETATGGQIDFGGSRPRTGVMFQSPRLLPWLTVEENVRIWQYGMGGSTELAAQYLHLFGLDSFRKAYPDQLSGGMARRALIAAAVAERPKLIIADEPTPGLDARAAGRILGHFRELAEEGAGVLLITHDLELALTIAHRVLVLYAGDHRGSGCRRLRRRDPAPPLHPGPVERPASERLCPHPRHPALSGGDPGGLSVRPPVRPLSGGLPVRRTGAGYRPPGRPGPVLFSGGRGASMSLEAKNLTFRYPRRGKRPVLEDVSLTLEPGERLGLSAPSGRGKTTLCRLLAGYQWPTDGQILLDGEPLSRYGRACPVQMIWQHPETALDPLLPLEVSLHEAGPVEERLLKALHIQPQWLRRYPRELSGGELQRFCIARALGPRTRYLLCDEITAMLDLITQAQIWQFLLEEAQRRELGLLVVSHNSTLLERICSRIVTLPPLRAP